MALITCPECGKEISDKVKSCPHCGYPFSEISQDEPPQKVEVTSVNLSPKNPEKTKKVFVSFSILFIAVLAIIITAVIASKNSKEAARAEYISNLSLARNSMLIGGAEAEALCNLTKSVWYNTIHEKKDSTTNQYTQTNGRFHSDFNTSLAALYADPNTTTKINVIKENQEEVANIMKELQNPPEDLNACYDTVDAMYESYHSFTELAISPSGSLTTYSQNFNTYDSDFIKYYQKLETQIPQE